MNHPLTIREVSLEEVFAVHQGVPEFQEHVPYSINTFRERTAGRETVSLIGFVDNDPAGYMVAYDRDKDGSFYCWMAGVRPEHRQQGVLKALMTYLQEWSQSHGYSVLKIKTRNHRREMLSYLVKHGFDIVEVEEGETVTDNRILFMKPLI